MSKLANSLKTKKKGFSINNQKEINRILEHHHPEIKNTYPHIQNQKKQFRKFSPEPKGIKSFLRNPNPYEKDLYMNKTIGKNLSNIIPHSKVPSARFHGNQKRCLK